MIDTTTPLGRAVAAALRLAEKRPWAEISLFEIADEAGLTLVELSRQVSSKSAVLRAFARLVDDEVLRKAERREPEESLRERLFDVVMTRFETMAPYRAGLKRIAADVTFAPDLVPALLASQAWMLAAAGISADGVTGAARIAGLASVYAGTFRDWLADDDPGMARTMAGLDRRLRRGESWIASFETVAATGQGIASRLRRAVARGVAARRGGGSAARSDRTAASSSTPSAPSQATAETTDTPRASTGDPDEDEGKNDPTLPPTRLH